MKDRRQAARGFALVSVLWGISILSLIAAAMVSTSRTSLRMESAFRTKAEAEALVEAGLTRAVLALSDTRRDKIWPVGAAPQKFRFAGTDLNISLEDESGKVDINTADPPLFVRLFRAEGLGQKEAEALAANIAVWRSAMPSADIEAQASADRENAYYHPRGGPFQSVQELRLVTGMNRELFSKLRPMLTVYSGLPTFNPRRAPQELLHALAAADASFNALLAQQRNAATDPLSRGGAALAELFDPTANPAGQAYTVKIAFDYRGAQVERRAIIRPTHDARRPYLVLAWNE